MTYFVKNMYFDKTTVLLIVCLCLLPAMYLNAAENDDTLRAVAERFIRQICEKDAERILKYSMTEEFEAIVLNAAVVGQWAAEIDRLFGRLGDVVDSGIVEHEQGLRSVYLYYQGAKRPAKIWVTFQGDDISGLHWDVWKEGYEGITSFEDKLPLVIFSFIAFCFVFPFLCIYVGESLRKRYIKNLRDVYLYQNEHIQPYYTESQNPAWMHILGHGFTLSLVVFIFALAWWTLRDESLLYLIISIAVIMFSVFFCELTILSLTGFFIEVDDQYLTVRMGIFRIRVLHLELNNILSVETVEFRPIRDFGGWGIRMMGDGWAYFLSGTEGVQVRTSIGKRYIIGSDIPDRLAKVIQGKVNAVKSHG